MAKGSKSNRNDQKSEKNKNSEKMSSHEKGYSAKKNTSADYLISMSASPKLGETTYWFQMLPVILFTAVVILIVRLANYSRPMDQFYFWATGGSNSLSDFFSYYKMVAIILCAILAIVLLLYKVFTLSFYIKRSYAYFPMIAYTILVLLSYLFSSYKTFALWGWNDRFEGTMILIAYMIMLYYTINFINSEQNVRWVIHALAVSSTLLGLLGITQAMNHDFFRTAIGKRLITPPTFWDNVDSLNFTFTNQIYQTVYNINYVSFYLTLLIPIFGVLFIHSMMLGKKEPLYKKAVWGTLFALVIFNLIGSASSGGFMGMAAVVMVAVIVLNKRILEWWRPVAILIALSIIVAGISYSRWMPELTEAIDGVTGKYAQEQEKSSTRHKLDYLITSGNAIEMGYEGQTLSFMTYPDDPGSLTITDTNGKALSMTQIDPENHLFQMKDPAFSWLTVKPAKDSNGNYYIILITDKQEWPFIVTADGVKYRANTGKYLNLFKVPSVGWEDNQQFGSGRGYIWSRTIPMMKDTLVLGHGADTYCIYFPNYDFVGKYNSGTFSNNPSIIVDKPHNMYFGVIIGTGGLSLLALFALWGTYIVQSFRIYMRETYKSYLSYAGAGIFFGICGFLVSALVDDSSVSVMPMFYGLLGTGIAVNMLLKKQIAD